MCDTHRVEASAGGSISAILATGTTAGDVDLHLRGPVDLVFTTSTIEPGGSTGWHSHPGPLLVAVQSGALTRYDADGRARVLRPGDSLVEPAGERYVHLGVNHGTEAVVLGATYVLPAGQPMRLDAGRTPYAASDR